MATGKYLTRRGDWFYVRIRVPPSLQASAGGATHLKQALHTKDNVIAERKKWPVIAKLKARLEELRKGQSSRTTSTTTPAGPRAWAERIRELRAEGDHEQADTIELVASDFADDVEAKHGTEAAGKWLRTAITADKALDELLEDWLHSAGLKRQTEATYRRAYRDLRAMLQLQDDEFLWPDDITDDVSVRFAMDYLPAQGLSQKSMATQLGALSSFWLFLQSRRIVPLARNPWRGHRITKKVVQEGPRSRRSAEKERAFSDTELVALLHGTEKAKKWDVYPRVRDLLVLGLYTGGRLNELASLLVKDVSIEQDSATLVIREGKTAAATRTLAVTHWAALEMLRRRTDGKAASAQLFDELCPGGPDGKLSWTASKAFTRYRRECGVPDGTDYHSLRRTFLTLMEHKGVDFVAVARFVGHQVPTMMHAVYSSGASRDALLKVADACRYGAEVEKAVAGL